MELIPIQVESYAGYQADETPRRFCWEDQWFEVLEVVDRWYQGNRDPEWPIANYFKLIAHDQRYYLLKHDRESNEWYLCRRW